MKKVDYNDGLYREVVKKFFKEKFDIQLIDTPDTYFKLGDNSDKIFIPGKYNFDLIPLDEYRNLTFVEVETVREKNNIFNLSKKTFNVLASKYWKYCTCTSKPGKFVYVQIDREANPTEKIAVINSIDIFKNCNLHNYKVLPSEVNYTGQCAVYEISKGKFIEYYDINESKEEKSDKLDVSKLIKVSDKTRKTYWSKFKNYSINDFYLDNCDILRFQGYKDKFPFEEDNCEYLVNVQDIKKYLIKLKNSNGFSLISADDVKKLGEKIEK